MAKSKPSSRSAAQEVPARKVEQRMRPVDAISEGESQYRGLINASAAELLVVHDSYAQAYPVKFEAATAADGTPLYSASIPVGSASEGKNLFRVLMNRYPFNQGGVVVDGGTQQTAARGNLVGQIIEMNRSDSGIFYNGGFLMQPTTLRISFAPQDAAFYAKSFLSWLSREFSLKAAPNPPN